MARISLVDPAQAAEPVREAFAALPAALNIFRVAAHAETCFRPMLRFGTAILGAQDLDARLRELAILEIARLSSARYEWVQHEAIARAVGVREEQVRAVEAAETPDADCFNDVERAVLGFTREVVIGVKASEQTFAELRRHIDEREVVELLMAIGFYMMIARLTETTETDLDSPAGSRLIDAVTV